MTHIQAIAPDEQVVSLPQGNQDSQDQDNAVASQTRGDSFDSLAQSTSYILSHALWLAQQKEHLSRNEYRKLLKYHGWQNEDRKYLKVAAAFKEFAHADLAQIEPATLFQLANSPMKYQGVIDGLLCSAIITQQTVRELIAKQRQPKKPKQEVPNIWRRTKNGGRYCQIPPIHEADEGTGTILQKMVEEEGLTPQRIVAEAIALRQAYKEGRLVLVENPESYAEEVSSEVWDDDLNTDAGTLVFEENTQDVWTIDPEPQRDDVTEDDGAVVEPKPDHCTPSPVELLIETFQTANTWQQLREALVVYEKHKQQAWDSLTPIEKKRVRELMPTEVRKLFEAKKAGLIVDFHEIRDGVYRVQRMGNLFAEVVSASRLDAFLECLLVV